MAAHSQHCDLLIAGGGLAGLTLARQLAQALPGLAIHIVEPQPRPLPLAAHKVGEATSELGAHYLAHTLQLQSHLQADQILKCGLRFFFGDGHQPLAQRPEYGPSQFPPISSYQLDRGVLENHLRAELATTAGVHFWEGATVRQIRLSDTAAPHEVVITPDQPGAGQTIRADWVADCTGRARLLHRQLRLTQPSGLPHSACWFRVRGRLDIADLVPATESAWHQRVPGGIRRHSTNHFVGTGYWVWVIPLVSGHTSLGIVVDERLHPISAINTLEKAQDWLAQREPLLAAHLAGFEPVDFQVLRQFSYHTRQFFSTQRWACLGEAAMFLDPFYSPGTDFIALGNTLLSRLLRAGASDANIAQCDTMMLQWQEAFTTVFRDQYPVFGSPAVMTAKVLWDNASYWVFVCQAFFQGILDQPETLERYRPLFVRYHQLNQQVQQLFREWAPRHPNAADYHYLGYADFAVAVRAHLELGVKKSPARFLDWLELNLERFQAWAVVLAENAQAQDGVPIRIAGQAPRAELASLRAQMQKLFASLE